VQRAALSRVRDYLQANLGKVEGDALPSGSRRARDNSSGSLCKTSACSTTVSCVTTSGTAQPASVPPRSEPTLTDPRGLYDAAVADFGPALVRLAHAYERDPHRREDLLQDIHFALWRSFASYDHRCAVRTWVYRVAHNVATSHMLKGRRQRAGSLVGIEVLEQSPPEQETLDESLAGQLDAERRRAQLVKLLQSLAPPDRQLMLLYLEGLDAAAISEITGLSSSNVATRIHRIKRVLAARVRAAGKRVSGSTDER